VSRPEHPEPDCGQHRQTWGKFASAGTVVGSTERARLNLDEDIVAARGGPTYFLDVHYLRAAEPAVHRGPHLLLLAD